VSKGKVVICTPSITGPTKPYIAALEASLPVLEAAGWQHSYVELVGCQYISAARATMLRTALDTLPDAIVFLDYDMSWDPVDLLKLVETEGDVVAGVYRPKVPDEEYMGQIEVGPNGRPMVREGDGAILATLIPAGFMKITTAGVAAFMRAWPNLCYGPPFRQSVDLFNHGAEGGVWWGEDYAFSRRYRERCGPIWIVPDLNLHHHSGETVFRGNFHRYLLRRPGGSHEQARLKCA